MIKIRARPLVAPFGLVFQLRLFGLRLLKPEAAAAFLPLAALLQEIDPLEALENIAPGGDFTGTFKRWMLAHFLFVLSRVK